MIAAAEPLVYPDFFALARLARLTLALRPLGLPTFIWAWGFGNVLSIRSSTASSALRLLSAIMTRPRNIPPHLAEKAGKCIFCGKPGLSRTHVFPDWLNRLLRPLKATDVEIYEARRREKDRDFYSRKAKRTQGSLFSRKPFLACLEGNTGWMKNIEDEVADFAKPILMGTDSVRLSAGQQRSLAGWIALITILGEYFERSIPPAIPARDRAYLKVRHEPPKDTWSIVAASLNGIKWAGAYRHHRSNSYDFRDSIERRGFAEAPNNTLITSLGMGDLFVQSFVYPINRHVQSFRMGAKVSGFVQIWPPPSGFRTLSKWTTEFPTKLVLTDATADEASNAFDKRLKVMAIPKEPPR